MREIFMLICQSGFSKGEMSYTKSAEGVESITEHRAQGEGDKWYYDVKLINGQTIREFQPITVIYYEGGG